MFPLSSALASEIGTIRKKWKDRLAVALLYANAYPVAISNLGFQLVYSLLNAREEVVCERFVYPEPGRPLRSLESSRPLGDFPLVFASISFEHDYPRLAAMLAAAGIEPLAGARKRKVTPGSPLVVLGGVGVFLNPEPLAAFADLMVIGEAEPVLPQLLEQLAGYGDCDREELLARVAATVPGCYAPGFTAFTYSGRGEVVDMTTREGLHLPVSRVMVPKAAVAGHSTLLSPEAELGMYMVELGRGCSRGCRFCAAGFIYRPPRLWDGSAIVRALEQRPESADRVGLLGMEMAESATVDEIARWLQSQGCALSFSSLRADRITDQTLSLLAASSLKSVAIAADGSSERLRTLINKGLGEQDLLEAAERLVAAGIFHLKLYVMIGLPTESRGDLDELVGLVDRLQARILPVGRARGRLSELTLSINCFVPKPWTPFQYCSFGGLAPEEAEAARGGEALVALKEKIRYLRRMLSKKANLHLKFDTPDQAFEQAVYSRADRRIGPALLEVGLGRASLRQALARRGLDPWIWAVRPRGGEERMCWEVVDHGLKPGYLFQEWQRALDGRVTAACDPGHCHRCGVCDAA